MELPKLGSLEFPLYFCSPLTSLIVVTSKVAVPARHGSLMPRALTSRGLPLRKADHYKSIDSKPFLSPQMPAHSQKSRLTISPPSSNERPSCLGTYRGHSPGWGAVFLVVAGHHGQGARETGEAAPAGPACTAPGESAGMSPGRNIHPGEQWLSVLGGPGHPLYHWASSSHPTHPRAGPGRAQDYSRLSSGQAPRPHGLVSSTADALTRPSPLSA